MKESRSAECCCLQVTFFAKFEQQEDYEQNTDLSETSNKNINELWSINRWSVRQLIWLATISMKFQQKRTANQISFFLSDKFKVTFADDQSAILLDALSQIPAEYENSLRIFNG